MSIRFGTYEFGQASYDEQGDVLYLRKGERREPPTTSATPEGTRSASTSRPR